MDKMEGEKDRVLYLYCRFCIMKVNLMFLLYILRFGLRQKYIKKYFKIYFIKDDRRNI